MKKYFTKATLLLVCVVVIIVAGRWGLANVYYFKVINRLNELASVSATEVAEDNSLKNNVDLMLSFHQDHPHYLVTAGNYYEKLAFAESNEEKRSEYLRQALELYKHSAALRKTWPRTWADIFRVKAMLGEFDTEFSNAVKQADFYGSKDEYVAKEIVFLMLRNWRVFSAIDISIAIRQLNNLTDYARFKNVYDYAVLIDEKPFFCNLVRINNIQTRFRGCEV